MDERDIAPRHGFAPVYQARGTRTPDMPQLLAVLAARQRVLPTAQAMRAGMAGSVLAQADRMVCLFSTAGRVSTGTGGAFNRGTAHYLSEAREGENIVYRGA
jgi:hypothetical protein